jgi:hypothetical protein
VVLRQEAQLHHLRRRHRLHHRRRHHRRQEVREELVVLELVVLVLVALVLVQVRPRRRRRLLLVRVLAFRGVLAMLQPSWWSFRLQGVL